MRRKLRSYCFLDNHSFRYSLGFEYIMRFYIKDSYFTHSFCLKILAILYKRFVFHAQFLFKMLIMFRLSIALKL